MMVDVREEVAELLQKVLSEEIEVNSIQINIVPRYRSVEGMEKDIQVGTELELSIKAYEQEEAHV